MSKYTTEVRYICEQAAGRTVSGEYPDIDTIIEQAYPKIFDVDNIPVYVQEHKPLLLKKILLHYYSRGIAYETAGLWKLKLNQKLKEIMPYYNQLYKSELLDYNPLENVNNTHTHSGDYSDTSKVDNKRSYDNTTVHDNKVDTENTAGQSDKTNFENATAYNSKEETLLKHSKTTNNSNVSSNKTDTSRDNWTLFSDTPQGGIEGLTNAPVGSGSGDTNNYLTSATHIIDKASENADSNTYGNVTETYNADGNKKDTVTVNDAKVDNSRTSFDSSKVDNGHKTDVGTKVDEAQTLDDNLRKDNGTDNYTNIEYGKIGVETYQEMVLKYRETFLNIDMMIINELKDLFMKVW